MTKQMKKVLCAVLSGGLILGCLTGCGDRKETGGSANASTSSSAKTSSVLRETEESSAPQETNISESTPESMPESFVVSAPTPTVTPSQEPTATTAPSQEPTATTAPSQASTATAEPSQEPTATTAPSQVPTAVSQDSASTNKPQTETPVVPSKEPVSSKPVQTAPAHTHSWTETGRSDSTDCFKGVTTTSISFSCSCGETKTDTQTATSVCDWQWVGEWQYDFSGCIKFRTTHHICVAHGTTTVEMPGYEEVDEHDYNRQSCEPSCETKGEIVVTCNKCGTHFPFMNETITTSQYPDGGGNGHQFTETSRRDLDELEAAWYGENKSWVTYTCSACGFSYNDVD